MDITEQITSAIAGLILGVPTYLSGVLISKILFTNETNQLMFLIGFVYVFLLAEFMYAQSLSAKKQD